MKKIIITIMIMGIFIVSNAQSDMDYNPYQHAREEYIKTGDEFFESFQKVDCNENKEFIQNAIDGYYAGEYSGEKFEEISSFLGKMYCPEIITFFEKVVEIDSSEKVRCDAMQKLGWLRAKTSVPILLNHLNSNISDYEKACIGSCLTIIGEWNLAVPVLNAVCFCKDDDILQKCIWSYYIVGGENAINYFNLMFEQDESRKPAAALFLAELGEYEKALPYFVEIMNTGGIGNQILYAIKGLAAIGTEEAFKLIKEQTQNKNEVIAKEAKWIFNYIDIKRRER